MAMETADRELIERFAAGETSLREAAIEAFRRNIPAVGIRGDECMMFMSEIDSPMPDLALRARYRRAVLGSSAVKPDGKRP